MANRDSILVLLLLIAAVADSASITIVAVVIEELFHVLIVVLNDRIDNLVFQCVDNIVIFRRIGMMNFTAIGKKQNGTLEMRLQHISNNHMNMITGD